MLIYEKKIENQETQEMERRLFGTTGNIPSEDDSQLTYSPEVELTVTSKLLDDGKGGMNLVTTGESGTEVTPVEVWLDDLNIIPGEKENEVISIAVTAPTKVTYTTAETLDLTGMVVTATYTNSEEKTISSGYTTSPSTTDALTADMTSVTVTYENKTASFAITVTAPENPNTEGQE